MPIAAVASQARSLNTEHRTHAAGAHLRHQAGKTRAFNLAGPGTSEVFVNDVDLLKAELAGLAGQAILSPLTLQIVGHLNRGRLPDIHDRPALQMIGGYL